MERGEHDAQTVELRRERDLYLQLLRLGEEQDVESFLAETLGLIVEVTGARRGYVELRDATRPGDDQPWSTVRACSGAETAEIREKISRGIIGEALARGETISTASALLDPRFADLGSVQKGRIEAVLCGPIGADPPLGVIYLEGRSKPGPFEEADRARVEIFGRLVAPLADRLVVRRRALAERDATRELRNVLRLEGVVGRSRALAAVLRQVAQAAPLEVDVLLTGESGTGKSQLAQVLHQNSARMSQPFVEVNCAAIPESLFENELFGHASGAYTGAAGAARGKVAAADGGTLFLDDVSEIPLHLQAKLLQLLQSKLYYPLGSTRPVRADVRVVAASNRDLEEAVRERRFREDLYYRLHVLPIRMPALDERREDVPELALAFLGAACRLHGFPPMKLAPSALRALETAEWPGHVRQLCHTIEAGAIRAATEPARVIEARHVFPDAGLEAAPDLSPTFVVATRCFQRELLEKVLHETDWNVAETARRLDLARSHVYSLIKLHGLARRRG